MASGIARGRVPTTATTTTTTESCNMAVILQIIGWQRHACSLGLLCTSLILDMHVMINWHLSKQGSVRHFEFSGGLPMYTRSQTPVPGSPFSFLRSPFSVLRSPFSVPRSPFPVPRSPFPVSSLHLWLLWNTQWLYMFWCEVKSTSFIDDIPYKYLRLFVRIVICIVGKPSICNRFWIEEKCIYNLYIRKQTEEKLTLQVCLSVSHVLCLLPSLPDITNRWPMTSIGSQWVIDE